MTTKRTSSIVFTEDAIDDLRRIGPDAVPRVLKKIQILEDDAEAGLPLGGELTGFRKLVVGRKTWRVIYRISGDTVEVCEVWAVGVRRDGEVYAEATARVNAAAEAEPQLIALGEVVARLGRLAKDLQVVTEREPVPDWLAVRLVHTARLPPEKVAAMDAEEAFEVWNSFITAPRPADGPQ